MRFKAYLKAAMYTLVFAIACKKNTIPPAASDTRVKADFTFVIKNQGIVPDTVSFFSNASNATALAWNFDNGTTSTDRNPQVVFTRPGTYNVKLLASNQNGVDSVVKQVVITLNKPTVDFGFTIRNQGFLPDTVDFASRATNATSLKWYFGDGKTDTAANPRNVYMNQGSFLVKLVATNAAGSDSVTKTVDLILNRPVANFSFTMSNPEVLPVAISFNNTTVGSKVNYSWSFGNGTSSEKNPVQNFTSGGIYFVKLVASNESGSDSLIWQIRISPYPQTYRTINGATNNLFAWEGSKVMILSRNAGLARPVMFTWLRAMDLAFSYYSSVTGREPTPFAQTFINNRSTMADVASTCGAACGYVGLTGIEIQNTFFDNVYNRINSSNTFEHFPFYEFGRNFWFYGNKLAYKTNDPVTTGYAVFMGFLAMKAAGVTGNTPDRQEKIIDTYLANPANTWANTLALGQSVPGTGTSGPDLFSSFCFRLYRDYGGEAFVEKLWKQAERQPDAVTTQDAVDNFFLSACFAANKNLTSLFQSWRWPLSARAITAAAAYP